MKTVKNYSSKTKILSLILSFLIVFYLVPTSVFAEIFDKEMSDLEDPLSVNEEKSTYTPEIYEVTQLREENVKHFRLEDGSYVAAQYNYPVHYSDENGQFTDINNRLEEGSNGTYTTSNSRVSFVKKITGNGKLFTFAENGVEISMSILNANKGINGIVTNASDSQEYTELQKKMNLENLSSKIFYEEVYDGVDIEYVVQSLHIKENIIVNEKSDEYSYSFELKLKNLTPTLLEDGSISFAENDGSIKYSIPAPVVYDANLKYADAESAKYYLEGKNGKYVLTVTVDSEWMNSESTIFPVTVDPTIIPLSDDGTPQQISTLMNVMLSHPLKIRLSGLPTLPSGSFVTSANLSLAYKGSAGFFVPRLVLSDTITGFDYDIDDRSGPNMYIWDITQLVRFCYENSLSYRDLTISIYDSMDTLGLNAPILLAAPSSDLLTINAPSVELKYAVSSGIEDYYSYSSHSLENAGSGSVNLATGNLTFISPLTSTTDYLMPLTVSAVYNSDTSDKYISQMYSYMASGYKLNIHESIVPITSFSDDGTSDTFYVLSDADGTEHLFYHSKDGYVDDSALGRCLEVSEDKITITYKNKTKKTFTKAIINADGLNIAWVLNKITDESGNSVIITLGSFGLPMKISLLPNGHTQKIDLLSFSYYNGMLSEINNLGNGDVVKFSYSEGYNDDTLTYSGNFLRAIEYGVNNDNTVTSKTKTSFTYNSEGDIISISDGLSGDSLAYNWNSTNKVTSVIQKADGKIGQTVKYNYGNRFTDLLTSGNDEDISTVVDNIVTRYIFDNQGRAVSVYSTSTDGDEIYGATMGSYDNSFLSKNSIKSNAVLYGIKPENIISNNNSEQYFATIQGGLDKTAETGCYKQTIYSVDDISSLNGKSNANMEFIISGFGYSNSIRDKDVAGFSLGVNVYYYQGENKPDVIVPYRFNFADVENVWQFTSGKISCKLSSTDEVNYDYVQKIEVVCSYYGQMDVDGAVPYAYFKDIALTEVTEDDSYDYYYNSETGNLEIKANSKYYEIYEYDEKNRITSLANSFGETYTYLYEEENSKSFCEYYYRFEKLISATAYIYNSYGLLTNVSYLGSNNGNISVENLDSLAAINTSYSYSTDDQTSKFFGALVKETDSLGNSTINYYNPFNGYLIYQRDLSSGTGYQYTYDIFGRLEKVSPFSNSAPENVVNYIYNTNGYIGSIETNSTDYTMIYDEFGNPAAIMAGTNTLATYRYYPNNGKLKKISYGNEFSEEYVYNTLEMLSEIWYTYSDGTREKAYSYTYNWDGTLNVLTDHLNGKDTQYTYDNRGRLSSIGEKETSDTYYNAIYIAKYDAENRVTSQTNIITNSSTTYGASYLFATSYGYGEQGQLSSETLGYLGNGYIINYNYDGFNRLDNIKYDFGNFDYTKEYTYVSGDKTTSYLVGGYTSTIGNTSTEYSYTYDSKGNITKIVIGDKEIRYTYDDLGQLIREENGQVNQDFDYIYDNAGNIVQKKTTLKILNNSYQYVTRYRYSDSEWGDLLTSYDGTTITYDEIGNPLNYYNGADYTFKWEGRRLIEATRSGFDFSFTYNDEGIRTSKTIDGVKHTYHLNGSQIVAEEWEDKLLVYLYDAAGSPIGMMYRTASYAEGTWDTFWFEKNLQGDVIAVYDNSGTQLIKYIYGNAWGDHSTTYPNGGSTSPAQYNPFRYRGYYYDDYLMLYYLQSRYYDPNTCRFINADSYISTGQGLIGYNMYAYCGNNPIMGYDPTGHWDWGGVIIGLILTVAGGAAAYFGSMSTESGALITGAVIITGVTMIMAAATDSQMVMDLSGSLSAENKYVKGGASIVIDFKQDDANLYIHGGGGIGYSLGGAYSVGIVNDYNNPFDYKGPFIDVFAGNYIGVDHCWSPDYKWFDAPKATSITFSSGSSYGVGVDLYSLPLQIISW